MRAEQVKQGLVDTLYLNYKGKAVLPARVLEAEETIERGVLKGVLSML